MEQLEDLLKEKGKIIYRYLRKMGASNDDAQDIVQDTLYKVILILHELDQERVNPWMFRVAYNQYIDLMRKRKRWGEIPIDTVDLIGRKSLEDEMIHEEDRVEIRTVFEKMNPSYKHILLLKYESDLSYKEIAHILSVSEDAVKTSLYRARQQFQKVYRRDRDGESG